MNEIDPIEAYRRDLGEEDFALWERALRKTQTGVIRNIQAECKLLEAEPTNEGVSVQYAENLITSLANKISQGL